MCEKNATFGEILQNVDYRERPSVYGLVVNDKDEVLLIRSPGGNFLPGGGLDPGETHQECLTREFLEETGHAVQIREYLGCGTLYGLAPRDQGFLKIVGYFYAATLGELISPKTEEQNEMFWVGKDQAVSTLKLPNQKWALAEYLQQASSR